MIVSNESHLRKEVDSLQFRGTDTIVILYRASKTLKSHNTLRGELPEPHLVQHVDKLCEGGQRLPIWSRIYLRTLISLSEDLGEVESAFDGLLPECRFERKLWRPCL